MNDIIYYLAYYWAKYPKELEHDPSFIDIKSFILRGGRYYLRDGIFILYSEDSKSINIKAYFCDMDKLPLREVKKRLMAHKAFTKMFEKPIYCSWLKPLFTRGYLFKKENNKWRWI